MMIKSVLISFLFITIQAQSFKDFKKKDAKTFQNYLNEYDDLLDYVDRDSEKFKKILNEIYLIWGDKKIPSKKIWVGYSKNRKQRISLDYEKKEVVIQLETEDKDEDEQIEKNTVGFINSIDNKNAQNDIRSKIDLDKIELNIKKKSNDKMTFYEIKLPFKSGAFNKLVEKVIPYVQKYSKKYHLDPRRVLAQIHVESAFNPRAISHANAYGLMQLVPKYGGKEAYSYLMQSTKIPPKTMLFDSEKNIELGCTYIHILNTEYFKTVLDNSSLELLSISAYNTGPNNVYKVFTSNKDRKTAEQKINKSDSKQILKQLLNNLPFLETRNYLKAVLEKKKLYIKI